MGSGYGKNYFLTDKTEENMNVINEIKEEMGVEV